MIKWKFYVLFDAFVVLSNTQLLLLETVTCWIDQKNENRKQEHLKTAWNLVRSFPQTFESELNVKFELGVPNDTTNQNRIQTWIVIFYSKPLCGIVPKCWGLSTEFENDLLAKQQTNNIYKTTKSKWYAF